MMDESECSIAFLDNFKGLKTPDGEKGRMVSLKGNTKVICNAAKLIVEHIDKIEGTYNCPN